MRHTTAILAIFLAVGARAADTTTPRYGLIQPASGSTNWASKVNGDFSVLDTSAASLGSTNTFTSAATTTVNAPWTWSASSITMSGAASYIVSGSSVNAGYFTGNGAGITNLPAASVASGILGSQVIASSVAAQAVGPDQLAKTAVTAGSYGSATAAPTLTVDAQGRLTAAGSATVTPAAGSITAGALVAGVTITPGGVDLSTVTTALAGKQATGNYITALTGNVTASGPGSVAATVVNVPQSAVNLSTVTTVFSNVAADTTTLYNIKASTGIDAGMTRAKNLATIDAALTASSTMTVLGSDAASNSLKLAGGGDVGGQLVVSGTATVQGNAFSVGGSTLAVSGGTVTLASTTVTGILTLNSGSANGSGVTTTQQAVSISSNVLIAGTNRGTSSYSHTARVEILPDDQSGLTGLYVNGGASNNGILVQAGNSSSQYALKLQTNAGADLAMVRSDGNVGIGTASPGAKLTVSGDSSFTGPANFGSSVTVKATSRLQGDDISLQGYKADGTTLTGYLEYNGTGSEMRLYSGSGEKTNIYSNGVKAIAAEGDGSVTVVHATTFQSSSTWNDSVGGRNLGIYGATTGREYMEFWNNNQAGGAIVMGLESSTGGSLATGSHAYSSIIGDVDDKPLDFITNDITRESIGAGGDTYFTGSVTLSASSLTVVGAAQFGGVAASSFSTAGYYIPTGWTSTQLSPAGAAPAPDKIGEETRNTTINDMCISTGTSAGNWALVGSKGATGCF